MSTTVRMAGAVLSPIERFLRRPDRQATRLISSVISFGRGA